MYGIGLVVGKFSPPHRGHQHLIETALAGSAFVHVLVVDSPGPHVAAALRAGWIRELYPKADVRVIEDIGLDDDSPAWAAHTIRFLGHAPNAVFSSEDYGDTYAAALGCVHVLVDKARRRFPVSGTKVRANPLAEWEFLAPPVRAHYVKRVTCIGAESTGTTTLAHALAVMYKTVWVPEYGRLFSEGKYSAPPEWRTDEFVHIAQAQAQLEDSLARSANKVLIADTDAFATGVWHERYVGHRSPEVEAASVRKPDLYLLTGDEIPFTQDGTRDGEHVRHWMHERFEERLKERGVPFVTLRGPHEERLAQAMARIDALLVH